MYKAIDNFVLGLKQSCKSVEEVSFLLKNQGLSSNKHVDLVRLVFCWITNNIECNTARVESSEIKELNQVVQSGKAKCGEYAALFEILCIYMGVPSDHIVTIKGQSRSFSLLDNSLNKYELNHVLNAVQVDESG